MYHSRDAINRVSIVRYLKVSNVHYLKDILMTGLLITTIILLFVVVIAHVIRIYEIYAEIKGVKQKDTNISEKENKFNSRLMLFFLFAYLGFYLWLIVNYKDALLPSAASLHGEKIDTLFNFNMVIINLTFVITIVLLFVFSYKYYYRKNKRALFFPHSNKLELIWTIVPAIVLTVIIIWGIVTWNDIMDDPPEDALVIELYSKQFDWTARYSGSDGQLGKANYKLIGGLNSLGLDASDSKAWDDVMVKGEFHIPVNKQVNFVFRSQDVIHSAYMPHFRVQMNCVPGMTTRFHFTPTKTTEEMRKITGNQEFNYILLCNKICGVAHFNMQMDIVVESEEDYNKWISSQKSVTDKGIINPVNTDFSFNTSNEEQETMKF